jgi:hypothetical protein
VVSVERLVRGRLRGRVRDLCLEVRDHGVVLHGRTRTYYVKQLAQHLVMAGTGLRVLANEIEVAAPPVGNG